MTKILALQIDELSQLNFNSDSSHALGLEAQKRGFKLFCYTPDSLFFKERVRAIGHLVTFIDKVPYYKIIETTEIDLSTVNIILIRQDPPVNLKYLTTCYLLDLLPKSVKILCPPKALLLNPEKIIPLNFNKYMVSTIISNDIDEIEKFINEVGEAIVKPLYGHGGNNIFRLQADDARKLEGVLSLLFKENKPFVVVQKFLPSVQDGDIRVLMSFDNILGCYKRVPKKNSFKANLVQGATAVKHNLTTTQKEICKQVGKFLLKNKIYFAGIDLIDNYLIEVNITSPTGLKAYQKLYNKDLTKKIFDNIL